MSVRVHRRWLPAAALLASTITPTLHMTQVAYAQCAESTITAKLASTQVPLSGQVVVDIECSGTDYCAEETPELTVTREDVPVLGNVYDVRGPNHIYLIWEPIANLGRNAEYQVNIEAAEATSDTLTISADSELTIEAPDLEVLSLELAPTVAPTGQEYCCEPTADECASPICFTEEGTQQARLSIASAGLTATPYALYQLTTATESAEDAEDAEGTTDTSTAVQSTGWMRLDDEGLALDFTTAADSYCATLLGMSLLDGSESSREVCVDADGSYTVGELVEMEPSLQALADTSCSAEPPQTDVCRQGDVSGQTTSCSVTPQGLVDAWCTAQYDVCVDNESEACLKDLEATCYPETTTNTEDGYADKSEDKPAANEDTTVESDGAGGVDTSEDAADESLGNNGLKKKSDGGCSVAGNSTAALQGLWPLAVTLMALSARRRRPRR